MSINQGNQKVFLACAVHISNSFPVKQLKLSSNLESAKISQDYISFNNAAVESGQIFIASIILPEIRYLTNE